MVKFSYKIHIHLKKQKIDFIAVAISHWHALSIDAFVYDLSNKLERKVRGEILILPHPKHGYIISEKDFHYGDFADLEYHLVDIPTENQKFIFKLSNFISKYLSMILGLRKIRSKKGINKLYLVSPLWPYTPYLKYFEDDTISSKYQPVFVLVDEGFGTYVTKKTSNLVLKGERKEDTKFSSLLYLISSTIFRSFDNIFRRMVMRYVPLENRFLFRKEGQLKINENICKSYKEVLKLRKNDLKRDKAEKTVIIITQPFSEYNQVSVQEEFRLMELLIKFINKKGIKPILKPHPREKSDKYNDLRDCDFEIIKNNFPVEEIIPFLNPICVIGYTSTALLNSKIFYGINAISLSNIIISTSNDKLFNASVEEFKNLTGNYINFVDDVEDIGIFI